MANTQPNSHRKHKRGRKFLKAIVAFLLVVLLFTTGMGIGVYMMLNHLYKVGSNSETAKNAPLDGERVNVLFLGIDGNRKIKIESGTRTDTMILLSYDPKTKDIALLSIPRDTAVKIPGHQQAFDKINAAHAYGGPQLSMQTVENFLGIPVNYYVETNFLGFVRIIDILGGIDINVEKDMYYNDSAQNLHISLHKGMQHLDGEKAIQYVRFRHDGMGDIGRIKRQQKFVTALADQLISARTIIKIPAIMGEISNYVKTDMPPQMMLKLALSVAQIKSNTLKTYTVPGTPSMISGLSYWVPDRAKTQEVVAEINSGQAVAGNSAQNTKAEVAVLNGSGKSGVANIVARQLEGKGLVIKTVGNADNFNYNRSCVIYKSGNETIAKEVARTLGNASLTQNEGIETDIQVIIGKDYIS